VPFFYMDSAFLISFTSRVNLGSPLLRVGAWSLSFLPPCPSVPFLAREPGLFRRKGMGSAILVRLDLKQVHKSCDFSACSERGPTGQHYLDTTTRLNELTERAVEWLSERSGGDLEAFSDDMLRDKVDELVFDEIFGPERRKPYEHLFVHLDQAHG
jgi:hypothetical protein